MKKSRSKYLLVILFIVFSFLPSFSQTESLEKKLAQVEENEKFEKPSWLGEEVTGRSEFYNSSLSKVKYWKV